MATITQLPLEDIEIILSFNDISIEDIINFRCVCKQFKDAAKYDKFMNKKFFQRWPLAKEHYNKEYEEIKQNMSEEKQDIFPENKRKTRKYEKNEQKDAKYANFIEMGLSCMKQLQKYVSELKHKYYNNYISENNYTISDISNPLNLNNNLMQIMCKSEDYTKILIFIDEIKYLLTLSPTRPGCDLTERLCYKELLVYFSQQLWKEKLKRFDTQPQEKQLIERYATIMAQWLQPQKYVFYSNVKALLDNIALKVLEHLKEKHPDHPILLTSAEKFSLWENNNIDDNYWDEAKGTQIMDALEEYIFGELNSCSNDSEKLEYMCIDYVLKEKCGTNIIIFIIFQSVARRLGLRCDIITTYPFRDNHIFWKSSFTTNDLQLIIRYLTLNAGIFPDCLIKQETFQGSLPGTPFNIISIVTHREMFLIFKNVNSRKHNYNILRLLTYVVSKSRLQEVKFAVGMIVTHDSQNKNCSSSTGVIIGWHQNEDKNNFYFHSTLSNYFPLKCEIKLSSVKQQILYIILNENNEMCYVKEDDITLTTPKWIDNIELGHYFCKFEGTYYVPNQILTNLYPQDAAKLLKG